MGKKSLKNYKKKQKEEHFVIRDVNKILQFCRNDYNKALKHCYENDLYDSFMTIYNKYREIQEKEEFEQERHNMKVEDISFDTYCDYIDYIERTCAPLCQNLESNDLDELFHVFLNK